LSPIDATVVVPVYNPGAAIESCIESLLGQSLPAERLEIIFSDDGSTDGTGERLDRLAAEHPHIRVIHSPNSGWPGRPRNLGIDAAAGEFIQFVDHDDSLGPEALERLVAYGRANDADIVIGKVTSNFRPVPHNLFRRNIATCTVWDTPLIGSLTPHKMFRRQFLLDTGIRYPEGKVRLEDQLFMVKTYFAAKRVSVLADYPCYFYRRRPEGEHAAAGAVEPDVYYHYLREVLDVIKASTEPGDFRNDQYRRFYRTMVRRTAKRLISGRPADYVQAYYEAVMKVTDDYFSDAVAERLPMFRRTQSVAMRAGKLDRLAKITKRTRWARPVVRLDDLTWTGTAWTAALTIRMRHVDGTPIVVVPSGDGYRLDPRIVGSDLEVRPDSREELLAGGAHADVAIRERHTGVRWLVPGELTARLEPAKSPAGALKMIISGEVVLDPATLALGEPLAAGTWDVSVDFDIFGLGRQVPLGPNRKRGMTVPAALFRRPARLVQPRFNPKGKLMLVVRPPKSQSAVLASRVTAVVATRQLLTAGFGVHLVDSRDAVACHVVIGADGARVPATLTATPDGASLSCDLTAAGPLPKGRSVLGLEVKPAERAATFGVLTVSRLGRVTATPGR
jgi:glycosyltransferase involved in cell wall biosynthesis